MAMTTDPDGTLHVGKHWMRMEGDVLFCKYVGTITLADVQQSMQGIGPAFVAGRTYYILTDMSEVTGMEAEARKLSTDWFAGQDIGCAVCFGAGTVVRAVSALILGVLRIVHKNSMPTYFVRDEEEARLFIQTMRQRRAQTRPSS